MKKYSVLIVDDEPIQRRIMKQFCEQSCFFETIEEAKDGVEAIGKLQQQSYHLLLLDINMPLLTGLSLAKTINSSVQIIFVTAYAEHAVEAFELNVLDYLMKPVSFERFMKAIQKLGSTEKPTQPMADTTAPAHLFLKQGRKSIKINQAEILYLEAKGNNTRIVFSDDTHRDFHQPFTAVLSLLPAQQFVRTHRSYAVNRLKINAIENKLVYIGTHTIPIGENYKNALALPD